MNVEKLLEWMRERGIQLTVTQSDSKHAVRIQVDTEPHQGKSIRTEGFVVYREIETSPFSAMTDALEHLMEKTDSELQKERNNEEENQSEISTEKDSQEKDTT